MKDLFTAVSHPLHIAMNLHNIALQMDIPAGMHISGDRNWLGEAFQKVAENIIDALQDETA